jgi:hypothetical protein
MRKTTLLCTFTTRESLSNTINKIQEIYELALGSVYVLQNADDPEQLILTYNIISENTRIQDNSEFTISVHRKKKTNTIYTINAINKLIIEEIGRLDTNYPVKWEELQDTVLVTAYGKLKKIKISVYDIIKIS